MDYSTVQNAIVKRLVQVRREANDDCIVRTLKLYGTGSATANAVAQVTLPQRLTLKGIQAAIRINSITDGAQVDLELSRASAQQIATNGALDSILTVSVEGNFVTSGLAQFGVNQFFPVDAPFEQGAILYLHALVAGTVVYTATFTLWY
jgi:hypothetical protein